MTGDKLVIYTIISYIPMYKNTFILDIIDIIIRLFRLYQIILRDELASKKLFGLGCKKNINIVFFCIYPIKVSSADWVCQHKLVLIV